MIRGLYEGDISGKQLLARIGSRASKTYFGMGGGPGDQSPPKVNPTKTNKGMS